MIPRLLLAISFLAGFSVLQTEAQAPPPELTQDNPDPKIEVQLRGPVHEAYLQPFDSKIEPGEVVPKQPPDPIPELPPDQKPEGDNVQWIPGYWAWDAERNDFLWVSGMYRDTPENRRFVPGYWTQTPEGWRWVAGFWANAQQGELPYVPEPPASVDNGPSVPPPNADSTYVPGYWYYQGDNYAWRPGYWGPSYAHRIWIPPHYVWTPSGWVFVDGYWDYPPEERGVLFTPVYFTEPLWLTPGWCYRPRYIVSCWNLLDRLFFRPSCRHYYFGHYYGSAHARYQPWYGGYGGNRFDPYVNYYRWRNRNTPGWESNLRQTYAGRGTGKLQGLPTSLAQQDILFRKGGLQQGQFQSLQVASTLNQVKGRRLASLEGNQLEAAKTNIQNNRDLAKARKQFEGNKGPAAGANGPAGAFKLPPQSGITARIGTTGPGQNNLGPKANSPSGVTAKDFQKNPAFSGNNAGKGSQGNPFNGLTPRPKQGLIGKTPSGVGGPNPAVGSPSLPSGINPAITRVPEPKGPNFGAGNNPNFKPRSGVVGQPQDNTPKGKPSIGLQPNNPGTQPRITNPGFRPGDFPGINQPKKGNTPQVNVTPPNVTPKAASPSVVVPKTTTPSFQKPAAPPPQPTQPRFTPNTTPKAFTPGNSGPKPTAPALQKPAAPPPSPPKTFSQPKPSPPSTPRVAAPSPPKTFSAPKPSAAPRSAPTPAPRVSAPAPAPRPPSVSAPRPSSPPPAPRPSGGSSGGNKGGDRRKK